MGHPDAAYDLSPEAQGRLLGWLYARAEKAAKTATPKKDTGRIDLVAMLHAGGS